MLFRNSIVNGKNVMKCHQHTTANYRWWSVSTNNLIEIVWITTAIIHGWATRNRLSPLNLLNYNRDYNEIGIKINIMISSKRIEMQYKNAVAFIGFTSISKLRIQSLFVVWLGVTIYYLLCRMIALCDALPLHGIHNSV